MKKLDIIYEDKNILVINKPAKILTISDGKTEHTLYSAAREYVKKNISLTKYLLFIVLIKIHQVLFYLLKMNL